MGKKEKLINEDKFKELQGMVCYISDQVAFLETVFNNGDPPVEMDETHFTGLSIMLNNIHKDTYKILDLIDEIQIEAAG